MAAPMKMQDLPENVKNLLKDHPSLELITSDGKLKCHYTGHEMNVNVAAIETYVKGRKYKKAAAIAAIEKYKPHIVPSGKKGRESQLFCTLTLRHLNKEPGHLERHVNGKRYKRALARWKECQEKGIEFKPRTGNTPKSVPGVESNKEVPNNDSGDEKNQDHIDDMSDLYPEADFQQEDGSDDDGDDDDDMDTTDDSDFEFEDLEPEIHANNGNSKNNSVKREASEDEEVVTTKPKKFQKKNKTTKLKSNQT
ncbi:surfeit locus protein 2-like [Tubulanus polymorphus]|uniref:surfeit locus protein 2-like n=1 Tax=Tubulanus polymorphus TaxID=672921 RepID=UPI003DA5BF18